VQLRTSYGDRTSPVIRGAWVLDKLMGTPPTPPPPDVDTDLSQPKGEPPKTLRARLERHRSKAGCNQCHGVIDPIGLAMENFDAIGRWRDLDLDANAPIDAKTVLPNGKAVDGPEQPDLLPVVGMHQVSARHRAPGHADLTAHLGTALVMQAQQGTQGHALARAGFADQRDHLAALHIKTDTADGMYRPAPPREGHAEIAQAYHRLSG